MIKDRKFLDVLQPKKMERMYHWFVLCLRFNFLFIFRDLYGTDNVICSDVVKAPRNILESGETNVLWLKIFYLFPEIIL